jgi:hypothetical protein
MALIAMSPSYSTSLGQHSFADGEDVIELIVAGQSIELVSLPVYLNING